MTFDTQSFLNNTFYLLALINPVSKVFFLSTAVSGRNQFRKLGLICIRSSIIAFLILLSFMILGNIIFSKLFHVEIYSFRVLGGIVLFMMGYRALSKGIFFEADESSKLIELAIIPLASPLIAGPATITAVIALSATHGLFETIIASFVAVLINFIFMLSSGALYKALKHYNLAGALIRVTGLIVATISVQMIFDGIKAWTVTLR